jgi:hypothetical protein
VAVDGLQSARDVLGLDGLVATPAAVGDDEGNAAGAGSQDEGQQAPAGRDDQVEGRELGVDPFGAPASRRAQTLRVSFANGAVQGGEGVA